MLPLDARVMSRHRSAEWRFQRRRHIDTNHCLAFSTAVHQCDRQTLGIGRHQVNNQVFRVLRTSLLIGRNSKTGQDRRSTIAQMMAGSINSINILTGCSFYSKMPNQKNTRSGEPSRGLPWPLRLRDRHRSKVRYPRCRVGNATRSGQPSPQRPTKCSFPCSAVASERCDRSPRASNNRRADYPAIATLSRIPAGIVWATDSFPGSIAETCRS